MYNTDQEQVSLSLMKTPEHGSTYRTLQKRLMINFTKETCGRGGEVKFKKKLEWNYKNYFQILDWQWFDMKTLKKYASGMDLHKFYLDLNSLNHLACFWAWEEGLWRCYTKYQITSFVFQDLHYQRDTGVSIMRTKATTHHL